VRGGGLGFGGHREYPMHEEKQNKRKGTGQLSIKKDCASLVTGKYGVGTPRVWSKLGNDGVGIVG